MSEIDLARKIFNSSLFAANGGTYSRYQTGSYSNGSSNGTFGNSSTRKGTVVSVDGNVVEVRLDGSSFTVRGTCETPVVAGQRVSAIYDGRTYVFIALSEFVQQTHDQIQEISDNLQETKEEILADVADDMEQVNQSVQEAVSKADAASESVTEISATVSGLEEEVDGFGTQISGAVETANSALSQASAAQQDLNGFKATVSQTYETKADADAAMAQEVLDRNSAIEQSASQIQSTVSQNYQSKTDAASMEQDLQTQITQNANAIQTEVTNRTQAVSDAVTESKSYTDQQADSITQTVETNVLDTVGQTYATKTELEQAEGSITATVEESVMDEVGNTYATKTELQQTSNGFQASIEGMQDDIGDAAKTATNYLTYTSAGLELSQSNLSNSLLLTPSAVELRQSDTPMTKIAPQKIYLGEPSYGCIVLGNGLLSVYGNSYESYPTYEQWEENESPIATIGVDQLTVGGYAMVGGSYTGFRVDTMAEGATDITSGNGFNFKTSSSRTPLVIDSSAVTVTNILNVSGSSPRMGLGDGWIVQGAMTRSKTSDQTLTASNAIITFNSTLTEFDPNSMLYAATNYIRVSKNANYSTVYVKVGFTVTVQGLAAGQNTSFQLYKGTTTSTTACTLVQEVLATPGGAFESVTLSPIVIPCTSTLTYFFVKGKSTGGGGVVQGTSDYFPSFTVEVVGAD